MENVSTDICGKYLLCRSGNRFLLAAYDVFSKFTVAKPVRSMTAKAVTEFIKNSMILRYACPENLLNDNGKQHWCGQMIELTKSRNITQCTARQRIFYKRIPQNA